jgi:hypothetical protein
MPLETHDQIFFFLLNSCGNSPYVTSSLTRGWVCLLSKVKFMLRPTVSRPPIWGLRPSFHYCQTIAGLLIWGALSEERTGLSSTMYNIQYIYILHAITWMYIQYIQGLCQSRLCTADHVLSLVASAYEFYWSFCFMRVETIFVMATIFSSSDTFVSYQSQSQSYVTTDGQSASLFP